MRQRRNLQENKRPTTPPSSRTRQASDAARAREAPLPAPRAQSQAALLGPEHRRCRPRPSWRTNQGWDASESSPNLCSGGSLARCLFLGRIPWPSVRWPFSPTGGMLLSLQEDFRRCLSGLGGRSFVFCRAPHCCRNRIPEW